jgi:DNA-binding CsgD family transcriptional regulator
MKQMIDDAADAIGAIYDCALSGTDWVPTLERIADLCGAENAALVLVDPRIRFSQVVTPRADPAVVAAYGDYWWQHDVTAHVTARIAPGVVTDLSVTGRQRFFRSAFYNEFWAQSGLGAERLASNLFCDGPAFGSFVIQANRARDELCDDMRRNFALLVPHMQRATAAARHMCLIEQVLSAGMNPSGDGILLIDPSRRVLHLDIAAEEVLRGTQGAVKIDAGRLVAVDPRTNDEIAAAIAGAINPQTSARLGAQGSVTLPVDGGHHTLAMRMQRIAPGAARGHLGFARVDTPVIAVLLSHSGRRQARSLSVLVTQWGLTMAEARLAMEMLRGDGRAAAAERCGISVNTARTHLGRIFEKAGVQRQAELIRRMSSLGLD